MKTKLEAIVQPIVSKMYEGQEGGEGGEEDSGHADDEL
jgi:hypothetical protein